MPLYMQYNIVQMSATASLGDANLTDTMGYVGWERRCGFWLIRIDQWLKKAPQEKV